MSLTVKSSGNGDFEITPEGTYVGRCIKVIDMGTQTTTGQFGTKSQKKVMISWELLDDDIKMQDGRPFAASQFYKASLHEKAQLRKDLEAWRGKKFTEQELEGFDLNNVLGTYCMLQVVHSSDGQYANVNAIMSYKGTKPNGVNDLVAFDISNPDMEVFNAFSDKMKAKIVSTPEWEERDKVIETMADPSDVDVDKPINLDDIPY
jgi:hypothetical protein